MKFMHFKVSCSYTALANLLELEGLDTEDDQIALDMGLPWIFAKDGDTYLAGPMLQGAKWFDLWLKPKGFAFREKTIKTEVLPETLQHTADAAICKKSSRLFTINRGERTLIRLIRS